MTYVFHIDFSIVPLIKGSGTIEVKVGRRQDGNRFLKHKHKIEIGRSVSRLGALHYQVTLVTSTRSFNH